VLDSAVKDQKTLAWIKAEIETTLKEIYGAPDFYIENLNDPSPIQACIKPLSTIAGVLKLVGIEGARILSEELLQLALSMTQGKISRKMEAAEVFARGLLQISGYIEALYHGQPDIPLILLPQLNDLRAAQDKDLLTEGEFFSPDLSVIPPIRPINECIVSGDLQTVAKKLRPGYLSGLVDLFQQRDVTGGLEKLILVLDNLQQASDSDKARQLWWIASGIADALYENSLDASVAVKILLGRVDRQIKNVIDYGESALQRQPPNNIIKNLLYYIAQADTYNNRITQIKKAFQLDYPNDNLVQKARGELYGFNANLIGTVSSQIQEEIGLIKDALDVNLGASGTGTANLAKVVTRFNTISDALSMLGLSKLHALLTEYQEFINRKIQSGEKLDEEDLLGIASALLHVESSIHHVGGSDPQKTTHLPKAEYDNLMRLVATEIINELAVCKDALSIFVSDPYNHTALVNVPEKLLQIKGVMQILEHDAQANLIKSVYDYTVNELINGKSDISSESMDRLADAIVGLEYFYEATLEKSVAPEVALNIAMESMRQLGYEPDSNFWDLTNSLKDNPNRKRDNLAQISVG